jgi:hypothetical protein
VGNGWPPNRYRPPAVSDSGLSLIAYFAVALVIVSPFAVIVVRRVLRDRRDRRPDPDPARPDDIPPRPDDLSAAFEAIEAGRAGGDEEFEVAVASRPLVDGVPAEPAVVDALLTDAITRSGLRIVAEEPAADGRILTLRRR